MHEPPKALQAFLDSYHKGYFVSHCGTCMEGATARRQAGTARAASALLEIEPDDVQRGTMQKAAQADTYLFELGKAYRAAGDGPRAAKSFDALRTVFPGSAHVEEIPK